MRVPEKDISKQYYQSKKDESKRPRDVKFIQQKLPTYYPVLNTAHFLPSLFLVSIIFIPLGIGIWFFSENIPEITIQYNECKSRENPNLTCEQVIYGNLSDAKHPKGKRLYMVSNGKECHCRVDFELQEDITGKIYVFYALTNFYQNHLKYYTSRDENQLRGEIGEPDDLEEPSSSCEPFDYDSVGRIIFPCGLQANTMFNDVIDIYHVDPERYSLLVGGERLIPLIRTGIAWESDKKKFKNSKYFGNSKHPIWLKFAKPWGWKNTLWELDMKNESNNGLDNEDFIVWMRTAAFPNFRKLYRIVDSTSSPFESGLPAGNYSLFIEYNYQVSSFDGTKSIILTTTRISGGKNHFLAISYMVVGGILMLLTFIFFAIYIMTRNRNMELKED